MSTDVLVIGAGVNGLFSALALARRGLSVCLLDRGGLATESTWAGAGILSPLLPWDYGPEVNALSERARALWPDSIGELARVARTDPEYRACGMLALDVAAPDRALAWCRDHGWRVEQAPAPGGHTGLWLPDVAQARNPRLAQALGEACAAAGVRILTDTEVTELEVADARVRAVRTREGRLCAERYVIAAGAWSQALLGSWAGALDIQPVRGQILLFQGTPGQLRHIVFRGGHYLVPRRDGMVLAGSTLEYAGFDKAVTESARNELLAFALDIAPDLGAAALARHWAGLRPGSPGNVPTISVHPDLGNLYLNSGHFRYGVTMAPASAELLADLMLGRDPHIDPTPYRWRATKLDVV